VTSLADVQQRATTVRPEILVAVGFSVFLLLYGNGVSGLSHDARTSYLLWANLAVLVFMLAWAFTWGGFSARELGLAPERLPQSTALGIVLSLLAAIPPVLFIVLAPVFNGGPVASDGISERSAAGLAFFVLFRQPVGTALFEEVAFRGVLYGAWQRVGGERAAIVGSAVVFALWHSVITSRTVIESGVVDTPFGTVAGIVVSLIGLFVGGLLFAYLRWRTGSIAAPFMAHWLIVALMTVAVWSMA